MDLGVKLCLTASGVFLMTGMATGTWKYLSIYRSPDFRPHRYASVAHQASLAYAFASLVLAKFAEYSPYSTVVTALAAGLVLTHFAVAVVAYIVHGVARDTENQFRPPYLLAGWRAPARLIHGFMWSLVVCEVAGAGLLFWGFLQTQILSG